MFILFAFISRHLYSALLQIKVEDLESQVSKLKKELKRAKESGESDASDFKGQSHKKDEVIQRLKVQKAVMEEEQDELKQKVILFTRCE